MSFQLKVLAGAQRGKTFPIPPVGAVRVGQGSEAFITVNDATLADEHFELTVVGGQVRVRDLGSSQGAFLNGKRLQSEHLFFPGDVLTAGSVSFQLVRDHTAAPRPVHPTAAPSRPAAVAPAPTARRAAPTAIKSAPPAFALARLSKTTLGFFKVGPLLNVARTGAIFRATDIRDNTEVALKVFLANAFRSDQDVARFTRAVKSMLSLSHRHLVKVLGGGRAEGHCWMSMELLNAHPITELLPPPGTTPSDWRPAERVLCDVARALVYLHDKKVRHRNLTMDNLLLCPEAEVVKVAGLVTSLAREAQSQPTGEGPSLDELRYSAPECIDEEEPAGDHRSDLYTLGAIVYTLLTGRPPIDGATREEVVHNIHRTIPLPIHAWNPSVPPVLAIAVMRLLSKDQQARFASGTELLQRLVRC
jgi:serine/threonine protein kinase